MRSGLFRQRACFMQLRHDHFGVGLSDSTSSTGDIIRALGFRAASLVAGLHIAGVSISVVLGVVDGLLDLRRCHRAAEHTSLLSIPRFTRCTQLVPRSCCHGVGRHYHRYGRCLLQSLLQVALSLCSRNDSLLPSSRLLLLLFAVLSSAVSLPFVVRILHGPVWLQLSGKLVTAVFWRTTLRFSRQQRA